MATLLRTANVSQMREDIKRLKSKITKLEQSEPVYPLETTKPIASSFKQKIGAKAKSIAKTNSNGFLYRGKSDYSDRMSDRSKSRTGSPKIVFRLADVSDLKQIKQNLPNMHKQELISLGDKLCGSLENLTMKFKLLNENIAESLKGNARQNDEIEAKRIARKVSYYKGIIEGLRLKLERKRAKIEKLKMGISGMIPLPGMRQTQKEKSVKQMTEDAKKSESDMLNVAALQRENRLVSERLRLVENDLKSKTLELETKNQISHEKDAELTRLREELKHCRKTIETERLNSLGTVERTRLIKELKEQNVEQEVA